MTINLNSYPYFDDFDKTKNFHKVLFHPGRPVQARELTQLQSILQNQIRAQGDHLFKNGTMVLPGEVFYDNTVKFVKLNATHNSINSADYLVDLIGKTITGSVSGVSAIVLHGDAKTDTDETTIYVKYTASNGSISTFDISDELSSEDLSGVTFSIFQTTEFSGNAAIVTVNDGVFYINGYFVNVPKQSITVSKYNNKPTAAVGLDYIESVVTESDDESLFDNARGFTNYGAPGAHRLKIDLRLSIKPFNYVPESTETINYVELLKVSEGSIQSLNNATQYSEIEKMLARRTFDESGDYVVNNFGFEFKEYRNNNRGDWTAATPYLQGDIVTSAGKTYVAQSSGFSSSTAPVHEYGVRSDGSISWLQDSTARGNLGSKVSTASTLIGQLQDESKLSLLVSKGKAYINGFAIEKQSQSTIIVNKARSSQQVNNAHIYAPVGSYALVTNMTGIVDTSTMLKVDLLATNDSTVLGTAWATTLEFVEGTPGNSAAVYKLYLFDIQMKSGFEFANDVLYIKSSVGSTFHATFKQTNKVLTGLFSTTTSSTTVTGKGTLFTQELSIGDQIQIGSTTKVVSSIQNDSTLELTSTFGSDNTDSFAVKLIIDLFTNDGYVVSMPSQNIQSLRDANGEIDTEYNIQKTISFTTSSTSHVLTLSTTGETFSPVGHIVVNTGTNAIINAGYSLNVDSTQLTITGLTPTTNYKIIAVVKRTGVAAKEKVKSIQTKTIIVTPTNVINDLGDVLSTAYTLNSSIIGLTESDVIRIVKITMSGATGVYDSNGETDVTSWYDFDSGQTLEYYGQGTLTRKKSISSPSKAIKVTFEYFAHSQGDYFSADSYSGVSADKVPTIMLNGVATSLKDCLDFRSRLADDGVTFSGAGGNVSLPLYSGSTISTSYSLYLPRKDVLSLTSAGVFEYFEGTPAINPTPPTISDGSLILANIEIPAYTNSPTQIVITPTANRRYTMQDIGNIDSRLTNVEQIVALSELEKATNSLQVLDANGLDRFKSGFIVDPFKDYSVADSSSEMKSAILLDSQEMTATQHVEPVQLFEAAGTTNSARVAAHYAVTGDEVTLPYTVTPLIQQLQATRSEFINPFAVFTWNGILKLTPERDSWFETRFRDIFSTERTQSIVNIVRQEWRWSRNWRVRGQRWTQTSSTTSTQVSNRVELIDTGNRESAPFMRSVPIVYEVKGAKPITSLTCYMDSEIINQYIYPAYKIIISGETPTKFLGYEYSSGNVNILERQTWTADVVSGGQHSNFFDKGEVIKSSSVTKTTAIVVAREVELSSTGVPQTALYVILPRTFSNETTLDGSNSGVLLENPSAFFAGQTITGLTSGAKATIVSVTAGNNTTNINGSLYGVIKPPSFIYSSGSHEITFSDATDGVFELADTNSTSNFVSMGEIKDVDRNNITTINTTITTTTVNGWWRVWRADPLAQTFTLPAEKSNGAYITSVDIYFAIKAANESKPVRVQIVETENGYPSQRVVKNADVLVGASSITTSATGQIATRFTFPGLVRLEANKEYAVKILTDSVAYKVWIAQMGEQLIDNKLVFVSKQPHTGVLFKSQNNSTWEANQLQDLKFVINYAKFDISRTGVLNVYNRRTLAAKDYLVPNPFYTVNGQTKVKVTHPKHGLRVGAYVTFAGSTLAAINTQHAVTKVINHNEYIVELASPASATGHVGGEAVTVSKNIKYDATILNMGQELSLPPGANVLCTFKGATASGLDTVGTTVENGEILALTDSHYVYSDENEALLLGNAKSLNYTINLWSTDSDVTPVINRTTLQAIVGSNIINTPSKTDIVPELDSELILSAVAGCEFVAATNTLKIPTTNDISRLKIGSYLVISDTASNNTVANSEPKIIDIDYNSSPFIIYLDGGVVNETPVSTTINQYKGFIDEISPSEGTSEAKYLIRQVSLLNSATGFKLMFAANVPSQSAIKAYYRTGLLESGTPLSEQKWIDLNATFNNTQAGEFIDQEYQIDALAAFNTIQVKLVLQSTNTAIVPKCKDLRVICLA